MKKYGEDDKKIEALKYLTHREYKLRVIGGIDDVNKKMQALRNSK